MFQLSNQYNELLSFYKQMAENGYHRNDVTFVEKVYSDAEPHKFAEQIKKIVEHFNAKNIEKFRSDFKNVIKFLKKNSQKNDLLLTNDVHTQIWWILSERNYFYFPYVFFVALNDNMIETQLINSFKYLKLDKNDFINYLNENKITDW